MKTAINIRCTPDAAIVALYTWPSDAAATGSRVMLLKIFDAGARRSVAIVSSAAFVLNGAISSYRARALLRTLLLNCPEHVQRPSMRMALLQQTQAYAFNV